MANSNNKTCSKQGDLFASTAVQLFLNAVGVPRCFQEETLVFKECDKAILFEELFFTYSWCSKSLDFRSEAESYVNEWQVLETVARLKAEGKIKLKATNPFNIVKDAIRMLSRNFKFSARLHALRITIRQVYGISGDGMVLQFVRYKEWQTVPFPNFFPHHDIACVGTLSSASMSEKQRHYIKGRGNSIAKVMERLDVVGSHFRKFPPFPGSEVIAVDHVDDGIKGTPELDSLYDVEFRLDDGTIVVAYVTIEIKDKSEAILEDQIRGQMVRVAHDVIQKRLRSLKPAEYVIGMAVAPREIDGDPNALCMWSLEPLKISRMGEYAQEDAHLMPFEIRSEEAVRFLPRLEFK